MTTHVQCLDVPVFMHHEDQLSRHALLSLADDALYQAKHAGRNRAVVLQTEAEGAQNRRRQPVAVSS